MFMNNCYLFEDVVDDELIRSVCGNVVNGKQKKT